MVYVGLCPAMGSFSYVDICPTGPHINHVIRIQDRSSRHTPICLIRCRRTIFAKSTRRSLRIFRAVQNAQLLVELSWCRIVLVDYISAAISSRCDQGAAETQSTATRSSGYLSDSNLERSATCDRACDTDRRDCQSMHFGHFLFSNPFRSRMVFYHRTLGYPRQLADLLTPKSNSPQLASVRNAHFICIVLVLFYTCPSRR
jgi:hypothetical protein